MTDVKIRCDDCKFVENCVDYGWKDCKKFTPKQSEPMTNEEWLRQASAEELAEVFYIVFHNNADRVLNAFWDKHKEVFKKNAMEWLKQPHK